MGKKRELSKTSFIYIDSSPNRNGTRQTHGGNYKICINTGGIVKMKQMNERNTKTEILGAYNKALVKIKELEGQKLDPSSELAYKKQTELAEAVEQVAEVSIESRILALKKDTGAILDSLSNNITEQYAVYTNVKEIVKQQQQKLQELFGIEAEAFSLVALINAKREAQDKFDIEFQEKKSKAEAELAEIIATAKETRALLQKEEAEYQAELEKTRKRDEEQFTYEFNRKKKQEEDKLQDTLEQKRRQFNEEVKTADLALQDRDKALKEREAELVKREDNTEALEQKVEELSSRAEEIRQTVTAEVTQRLTSDFSREKSYLDKEAKQQQQILESKIEMLEKALQNANGTISDLSSKLDGAYKEIKDMATKTVDSSSDRKVAESLSIMLRDANKGNSLR